VDALITGDAAADLKALNALRPKTGSWGLVIGHQRGFRFFVERIFFPGAGAPLPSLESLEELGALWNGGIVGLLAVRPDAAFKRFLLGPYFFGRLYLDVRLSRVGPVPKAYVVEFDRVFYLSPVPLEYGPERGNHERTSDA
jgi:hypothetical protein